MLGGLGNTDRHLAYEIFRPALVEGQNVENIRVYLQCSEALGTLIGTLPMRYLGLPLSRGRMLRTYWNPVIEKVKRRLEGLHAKILSRGGCLVLLRSILTAIPLFYLSINKLPIGVGKRLEELMRRFLWNESGSEQRNGESISLQGSCLYTHSGRGTGDHRYTKDEHDTFNKVGG